jgi:Mitochondrial ribosomal subunit
LETGKKYSANRFKPEFKHFQVKMSGPLPRLSEDSERIKTMKVFTPFNPWAPKRALFGQNDYIDILGDDPDAIKPHQQHYHIPRWSITLGV